MTELRQLRQRITLRCRTVALTLEETFGYIAERLRIAGANGESDLFEGSDPGRTHVFPGDPARGEFALRAFAD